MTQEFLNSTQVRPGVEEMGGKGMAQRVRAGFQGDAAVPGVPGNQTRHAARGEPLPAGVEKDRQRRRRRRG